MNNNQKKKLMFAPMSGKPANNTTPTTARESNSKPMETSGAIFRSVSMGVTSTAPQALFAQTLPTATFHKSHSTPLSAVRPSSANETKRTTVDLHGPAPTYAHSNVNANSNSNVKEWVWILTSQEIQPIPIYHPMERTAITLDLALDTIAARISTFLRQQSIPAQYDNEGSRVRCMTDTLLKFVVQLWQSADGAIVVEIQRRQGCCIAMQTIRHKLIEAIQTGTGMEAAPKPSRSTCGLLQDLLERTQLPPPPSHLQCQTAALDLVRQLLDSERLDAQRLGLESLVSLTDTARVLLSDADEVSHTVLSDPIWHTLLVRYFETLPDQHAMDCDEGDFVGSLHLLALKAIAQSVESLASSGKTASIDLSTPFWGAILQSLYANVTFATHRPLEAVWSIRCLRYLESLQPEVLQFVPDKTQLYASLRGAHHFGKQHHRSLEVETEQWMGLLGVAY